MSMKLKTRMIGTHGTRKQYWSGAYWVEREADGAFNVYFGDGRWLGWTDASGKAQSSAGLDSELREDAENAVAVVISKALTLAFAG